MSKYYTKKPVEKLVKVEEPENEIHRGSSWSISLIENDNKFLLEYISGGHVGCLKTLHITKAEKEALIDGTKKLMLFNSK